MQTTSLPGKFKFHSFVLCHPQMSTSFFFLFYRTVRLIGEKYKKKKRKKEKNRPGSVKCPPDLEKQLPFNLFGFMSHTVLATGCNTRMKRAGAQLNCPPPTSPPTRFPPPLILSSLTLPTSLLLLPLLLTGDGNTQPLLRLLNPLVPSRGKKDLRKEQNLPLRPLPGHQNPSPPYRSGLAFLQRKSGVR